MDQFKYYLWGRRFTVATDHAPLQWLNRMKDTNWLMRWYVVLQPYSFMIRYRKGHQHTKTDVFSRQATWNTLEQQAGLEGGICEPSDAPTPWIPPTPTLKSASMPPLPARGRCIPPTTLSRREVRKSFPGWGSCLRNNKVAAAAQ